MEQHAAQNSIYLPDDAGEHAEGLERLLRRIPSWCGAWISCGKGWYPLLVRLDTAIAQLAPDYQIHQVKEKYGTLRYYIGFPVIEPACCVELDHTDPRPFDEPVSGPHVTPDRAPERQHLLDAWLQRRLDHTYSPECQAAHEALENDPRVLHRDAVSAQIDALIAAAGAESARTCESCGADGTLAVRNGWYKTLCRECVA